MVVHFKAFILPSSFTIIQTDEQTELLISLTSQYLSMWLAFMPNHSLNSNVSLYSNYVTPAHLSVTSLINLAHNKIINSNYHQS